MKKLFVFILLCFGFISMSLAGNVNISISGRLHSIKIYKFIYGAEELVKSINSSDSLIEVNDLEDGGVYVIYSGFLQRMFIAENKLKIEVKENIIELNSKKGINISLNDWYNLSDPVRCISTENYRTQKSVDTLSFFKLYRQLSGLRQNLLNKYVHKLSKSNYNILVDISQYDIDAFLYAYIVCPISRSCFKNMPNWIKEKVNASRFTSKILIEYYPTVNLFLQKFAEVYKMCGFRESHLKEVFQQKDIAACYALTRLKGVKTYADFKCIYEFWKNCFVSDLFKERLKRIENGIRNLAIGEMGLNFSLLDNEDKILKFSDFRGKVVLLDLWASWCGPCKRELPYLRKLKEELEGEDFVVIGISVDDESGKEYWKRLSKGMGKYQVIDSKHVVSEYYKCNSVPLFLLFDKEGKIVSLNAPRPSNPQLKELIKSIL